jgi:hypothetical protein
MQEGTWQVLFSRTWSVEAKEGLPSSNSRDSPYKTPVQSPSKESESSSKNSLSCHFIKYDYLLHSKLRIMEEVYKGGGFSLDKGHGGQACRKYFISLS